MRRDGLQFRTANRYRAIIEYGRKLPPSRTNDSAAQAAESDN